MIVLRGTDAAKKLEYVFKLYDKDLSGFLSREEIDLMLNALLATKAPGDRQNLVRDMVAKMDANKDGKVSQLELSRALTDANFMEQYIGKGATTLNVADAALGNTSSRLCTVM